MGPRRGSCCDSGTPPPLPSHQHPGHSYVAQPLGLECLSSSPSALCPLSHGCWETGHGAGGFALFHAGTRGSGRPLRPLTQATSTPTSSAASTPGSILQTPGSQGHFPSQVHSPLALRPGSAVGQGFCCWDEELGWASACAGRWEGPRAGFREVGTGQALGGRVLLCHVVCRGLHSGTRRSKPSEGPSPRGCTAGGRAHRAYAAQ